MKVNFNRNELDMLQYVLLDAQINVLDTVNDNNFSCNLNYISLGLTHLYKKVTLMKKELEKNG